MMLKKKYKYIMEHLSHGYINIYNNICSLFSEEEKYKTCLLNNSNEIFEEIKRLMKCNFPNLKPGEQPDYIEHEKYVYYDINLIYKKLIKNTIENSVIVNSPGDDGGPYPSALYFNSSSNDKIMRVSKDDKKNINTILTNFNYNVWLPLNNKFKEKIEELCKKYTELRNNEKDIKNDIQKNIINNFKSGHIIEGYCKVCENIHNETDITKLRPKI